MYNMFVKDSDDEDEDEWFYDSIKRYKQLRMFDLENVIRQIELCDMGSICVVGEHEILQLSLPDKITVAPSQEGLVKNSDLKMRSGGYTTHPVTQMKAVWNQKKVIISESEQTGASVYNLGSGESDLISRVASLTCDLVSPLISVNSSGLVLLTTRSRRDFVVVELNSDKVVHKASVAESESERWLEPSFVSDTTAALCDRCTGDVILHDIRASKLVAHISHGEDKEEAEVWRMGSSADNRLHSSSASNIGLASSLGKLLVYDTRNCHAALCEADTGLACARDSVLPAVNFSPDDQYTISVSGFDDKVYVYNTSSSRQLRTMFTHDGHARDSYVTCHVWYRDNTVISASENKSLHCWQFNPDTET